MAPSYTAPTLSGAPFQSPRGDTQFEEDALALGDYKLCDVCGGKVFYDAELSYDFDAAEEDRAEGQDYALGNLGVWRVLCRDCARTHEVVVAERGAAEAVSKRLAALEERLGRESRVLHYTYRRCRSEWGDCREKECVADREALGLS